MAGPGRSLFTIERSRGVDSLEQLMYNLGRNFGDREVGKAVRIGWLSTKAQQIEAARAILPARQTPYEPSHYASVFRPRRRPGDLRRSVKFKATPVKVGQVPRSYLWARNWPWPFLVHGTQERKRKNGQSTGAIPDRVPEEQLFDGDMPRMFSQALATIAAQPQFQFPFSRHR